MSTEKKYVGSGTETQYNLKLMIDLTKVGKIIIGKDGKKYLQLPETPAIYESEYKGETQITLKLIVGAKKEQTGKTTHWVALDEWQPNKDKPKESTPPKIEDEPPF